MHKLIMRLATCLLIMGTLLTTALHAEEVTATESYDSVFFNQYAPNTALDMVSRLPGFSLSSAENKRGLGQGGANVLINGERATGKTGAGSQLGRISAKNVTRIEILDGASLDIPGLTGQVANVITKTSGITGTWSWSPQVRRRQPVSLGHIHATVSGEYSNWTYSAELRNEQRRNGNWGIETLTAADGTLFETRNEDGQYQADTPGLLIDLSWKPATDRIANINLEYNRHNFRERELSNRTAITTRGNTLDTIFSFGEDETNWSIGSDYEFPLASGKLKTIAYHRFEESPTASIFDVFDNSDLLEGSRFSRVADESESILRTEYSWNTTTDRDWQIGLEGAFNVLDIDARLQTRSNNGQYSEVALEGASSRVEEKRSELTITHSRKLNEKWDLQASIGGEFSELTQTGGLSREFTRPKGFISSTYKPDDSLSIRTKLERVVGQLSFFDFISSVSVSDDLNSIGNVNLVPSQSWYAEIEFDKDFGEGNSSTINIFGEKISDLVDRIPIGVSGDAVGNIDNAYQYGIETNTTLKGDRWGYPGTELIIGLDFQKSEVDDPLTGISRRLNGDEKYYWGLEFRHDVPDTEWAYGFDISQDKDAPRYRLNNIGQYKFDGPRSSVFVEHKDFFGMKVKPSIVNLFSGTDDFTRQLFTDRRDIGVLDFTESRSRGFDPFFSLEVSSTF